MIEKLYIIDENGFLEQEIIADPVTIDPSVVFTDEPIPDGIRTPKFVSGAWVDDEPFSQSELDQNFVDYCNNLMVQVTESCAEKFELHFFNPKQTERGRRYLKLVHTLKGEVANAHWNDNDKPPAEVERYPRAKKGHKDDATIEYFPLLTREAAANSITLNTLVSIVKSLSDIQIDALDDIEELRSPTNGLIKAERDKESAGSKVNDYAAVDSIFSTFQTSLDAIVSSWVPVQ